ncbi:MAG TPA: hypothetical protein VHE57_06585 [Mycobacteriales bacterium]|nr:hypothetical protein [Mycobacteriales bacterium]
MPTAHEDGSAAPAAARLLGVGVVALAALTACSGSSSGGSGGSAASGGSGGAATSPAPSATKPGAYGPNGKITKPAYNPPSSTSPGGSTVYPRISQHERKKIANHVIKMPGVRTVTYYPQFKQIQVYFKPGTTTEQRQAVYRYITAHAPAAAGSPSPSPSATS